jgi:hypothetical protein
MHSLYSHIKKSQLIQLHINIPVYDILSLYKENIIRIVFKQLFLQFNHLKGMLIDISPVYTTLDFWYRTTFLVLGLPIECKRGYSRMFFKTTGTIFI